MTRMRSLLYVPGNQERFYAKAGQRGADAVILDLEDAVPLAEKDAARDQLAASVPLARAPGAQVFVRINTTPDRIEADAVAAAKAGADGLYLPKIERRAELERLDGLLKPVETGRPLVFVPLIESPEGLFNARDIAGGPRVVALSAGGEDLATSLGAQPTTEVLRVPKLMIHYAAKAAGLKSLGLFRSTVDFRDLDGVREAAREARLHGFDGASCIHPSVVAVLNEVFSPSGDEIAWALKVVAADRKAAAEAIGAFELDGKFIDAPIVERARNLLAAAGEQA